MYKIFLFVFQNNFVLGGPITVTDDQFEELVKASSIELTQQLSHIAGQTNHTNSAPSVLAKHLPNNSSSSISTVQNSSSTVQAQTSVNTPTVINFRGSISRPNVTSVIVGNDVQEYI